VACANLLALESDAAGMALNIGSGVPISIAQVGIEISHRLGMEIQPEVKNQYRLGDIRHCFANISRASQTLGYQPAVSFREGVRELVDWLACQRADDHSEEAMRHLTMRGLVA
jgi:dTDP-L-rhamnose 4-epimerase